MLPSLCSRRRMDLKKKLFEEFQDDCLMNGYLWYLNGMIWAIQALHFALMPPIKFLLARVYGLEKILFEVLKTAAMVAQHTESAGSEFTISSLMPHKFSHCALQICQWFLEFWTVQKSNLTTLSLSIYARPNLSILIAIIPHDSTLKHYFVEK